MNTLQLAVTVQLALYVVAIAATLVAIVRFMKLQRLARQYPDQSNWWQSEPARAALAHTLRPLWITAAALLLGAFAPRLLGALG